MLRVSWYLVGFNVTRPKFLVIECNKRLQVVKWKINCSAGVSFFPPENKTEKRPESTATQAAARKFQQ